jgi:hypothetical protein
MSKHLAQREARVPRVYTIARELKSPSIEIMLWLRRHNHPVKSASSPVYLNQLSPDDLVTLILDSHKTQGSYHGRHCDWSISTPISFPKEA